MLKSVLALSSLNVIGQIGVLAFVSISSWYLGSEQYGRYAVLVSLISIGAAVSTLSIEFAIPNYSEYERNFVARCGAGIVILMSVLVSLLIVLYTTKVISFFACLFAVSGMGFLRIVEKQFIANGRISHIGYMRIAHPALSLLMLSVVLLDVVEVGHIYFLYVYSLSIFTAGCYFYIRENSVIETCRSWKSFRILIPILKSSNYLTVSGLLGALTYNLPVIIVEKYLGASSAGLLSFVFRTCFSPINTIGSTLGSVLHHRFAESYRSEKSEIVTTLSAVTKYLIGSSLLLGLAIYFVYPVLIGLIFGDEWVKAGALAKLLIPMFSAMLVVSPISVLFYVFSANKHELVSQSVYVAISILSFGCLSFGASLEGVVILFSLLVCVRYLFVYSFLFRKASLV